MSELKHFNTALDICELTFCLLTVSSYSYLFILAAGNDLIRCTINRPILDYSEEPSDFLVMNDMHMPLAARPRDDLSNIQIVAQNDYLPYRQVRMLA